MTEPPRAEDEWQRKQAVANAMVTFLEGWVAAELCAHFRMGVEAVYSDTFEHRLLRVLSEERSPQSLQVIASKCGVSRTLMLPERRLRKAIERMERSGIVSKHGPEDRPRYSLNDRSLACQILRKIFEKPESTDGLIPLSLRRESLLGIRH